MGIDHSASRSWYFIFIAASIFSKILSDAIVLRQHLAGHWASVSNAVLYAVRMCSLNFSEIKYLMSL